MHQHYAIVALYAVQQQERWLLLQVAAILLGLKSRRWGVQEVSWLLRTGVFRDAAPVAQLRHSVLPTLMLPKRRPALAAGFRAA